MDGTLGQALAESGRSVGELAVDSDAQIMPPTNYAAQAYHYGVANLRGSVGK